MVTYLKCSATILNTEIKLIKIILFLKKKKWFAPECILLFKNTMIHIFPMNCVKIVVMFSVEPTPTDGIMGYYIAGLPDGSRPGVFKVNVHRPNEL
jgi:hypothetical protein